MNPSNDPRFDNLVAEIRNKLTPSMTIADIAKNGDTPCPALCERVGENADKIIELLEDYRKPASPVNKYGKLNGGYWMLLTDIYEVEKHLFWFETAYEYVLETLEKPDGVIAINNSGAYHGGVLSDYTDVVEAEDFPD